MFHGGDSDSTGAIAGAWFGALYGFKDVPKINYQDLEKKDELKKLAQKLHQAANSKKKN